MIVFIENNAANIVIIIYLKWRKIKTNLQALLKVK